MSRLWGGVQTPAQLRYAAKLKDPRWLERRQSILDRDGYTCQGCKGYGNGGPLQVHHREYISGHEPWDYPGDLLVTLCQSCHELETDYQDCLERARQKQNEPKPNLQKEIQEWQDKWSRRQTEAGQKNFSKIRAMQGKLESYERNKTAAENALKQAKIDHDADAKDRALWVLGWATEGQKKATEGIIQLEKEGDAISLIE